MKTLDIYIEAFKIIREKKKYSDISVIFNLKITPDVEAQIRQA